MKKIAKIAAVASACALAAALTACGGSNSAPSAAPEGSEAAAPEAVEASAPVEEAVPAETSAAVEEAVPVETSAAVEEAAPAETSAAVEQEAGVALEDAKSYENENFGIAFGLPEGWAFIDTSADQAQLDAAGAGMSVEAKGAAPDGSAMFVITYEPLGETNADHDEAAHAGSLLGESLADAEVTDASITLGDREIPARFASVEKDGVSVAVLAAAMKNDQGFLDIVISAPSEEEVAAIAKSIVAL